MEYFNEQPKFEIKSSIEQKPLENPAVQSFLSEWCKINDSIVLRIVSRNEWEEIGTENILKEEPYGKNLFLPEDLQLWEMIGVIKVIDHDTFTDKPGQQDKKKEELQHLGKLFKNTGIYIAQRLEKITDGREIAQALAEEFYEYGQSLESGKRSSASITFEDILSHNLSSKELEEIDRFLAGERLYNLRQARIDYRGITQDVNQEEQYEKERCKTLAQFFRASKKAFELKQKTKHRKLKTDISELKPWQTSVPIHNAFLKKIEQAITKKIKTPEKGLETAIFHRGMRKLVGEISSGKSV